MEKTKKLRFTEKDEEIKEEAQGPSFELDFSHMTLTEEELR